MITLKSFQQTAVENALDLFFYTKSQLDEVTKESDRSRIVSYNGSLLLQAPTGAGKTFIAGTIAEKLSAEDRVVWFWFAPFAGLIKQTESSLRDKFPGLRVRDLKNERVVEGTRSGDVYVATWASVATEKKESRKVRLDSETGLSIDHFVPALREKGFRIGVVVDESHHGFGEQTKAATFYSEILKPDYTVLVTATPNDQDAENFKKKVGIEELHRITVSRIDAVESGLIKHGIKSVAYFAAEDKREIVDYELAALKDGVDIHKRIKAGLKKLGIDLTPLLLVQVDSTEGSVERVREKLRRLGIQEESISSHTADEPDANLLALAVDETKEVLIFKMAVALGFDAPRAFTLVSMRGSKDPDFGTQIVGRILRVHYKLQGVSLPDLLKYGYVILADSEAQEGIHIAAQKINAIKTQLTSVSPFTMLVKVAGQAQIQVVTNGQSSFLPVFEEEHNTSNTASTQTDSNMLNFEPSESSDQLALLDILTGVQTVAGDGTIPKRSTLLPEITETYKYNLKSGVPIRFWTQQFSAAEVDELVKCVTARIRLDDSVLMAARTQAVDIIRSEQEIFDQQDTVREMIRAAISLPDVEEQAQRMLLRVGYLNPQELQTCLLERLKTEFETRGQIDIVESEDGLDHALSLIMVQHPGLLRRAEKECYADFTEVAEADPLPGYISSDQPLQTSHLNIYGVVPPDLNSWERDFAQMLDNDLTGTVKWWHRNPPLKPYSVRIVLPDGSAFFPDFVVGIKDRSRQDNILLVETKEAINRPKSILETTGEHKKYGRALMVYWEEKRRWMTVRYDETTDKNIVDSVFRVNLMPNY